MHRVVFESAKSTYYFIHSYDNHFSASEQKPNDSNSYNLPPPVSNGTVDSDIDNLIGQGEP